MVNTNQDKAFVVRTEESNLCTPGTFRPIKVIYRYSENDQLLTIDARNSVSLQALTTAVTVVASMQWEEITL